MRIAYFHPLKVGLRGHIDVCSHKKYFNAKNLYDSKNFNRVEWTYINHYNLSTEYRPTKHKRSGEKKISIVLTYTNFRSINLHIFITILVRSLDMQVSDYKIK